MLKLLSTHFIGKDCNFTNVIERFVEFKLMSTIVVTIKSYCITSKMERNLVGLIDKTIVYEGCSGGQRSTRWLYVYLHYSGNHFQNIQLIVNNYTAQISFRLFYHLHSVNSK